MGLLTGLRWARGVGTATAIPLVMLMAACGDDSVLNPVVPVHAGRSFPVNGLVISGASQGPACALSAASWSRRGAQVIVSVRALGPELLTAQSHDIAGNTIARSSTRIPAGATSARLTLITDVSRTADVVLDASGTETGSCIVSPAKTAPGHRT
jgi:hypothetical protein